MIRKLLFVVLMLLGVNAFAHGPGPKHSIFGDTLRAKSQSITVYDYPIGNDTLRITQVIVGSDTSWYISGARFPSVVDTAINVRGGVGGLSYFTETDDNDTSVFTATAPNTTVGFNDNLTLQGNNLTGVGASTFGGDMTLDDDVGDSPATVWQSANNQTFSITKNEAGEAVLYNGEGSINLKPNNDGNDYLSISTTTNNVTIEVPAGGGSGDLTIKAGGGDIDFDDDNVIIKKITLYTGANSGGAYDTTDVPSDGDVWTWNTGGTIDWQAGGGGYILAAGDTVGGTTGLHDFNRINADTISGILIVPYTLRINTEDFTDLVGAGLQNTAGVLQTDTLAASEVKAALDLRANTSTNMIAGAGLTGGGTLAADRTFNVSTDIVNHTLDTNEVLQIMADNMSGSATIDNAGIISVYHSDSTESLHIPCRNTNVATITKGTPVFNIGYSVGNGILIGLASASSTDSMPAIGVVEQDIAQNTNGSILIVGRLTSIKTDSSGWADGTALYVAPNVAGLTHVKPTDGSVIQKIGTILRSSPAASGVLLISGANRTNDIPNFAQGPGYIWAGGADSSAIEVDLDSAIAAQFADSAEFDDSKFRVYDNGDGTKLGAFELSGVSTGNTRTLTWPNIDGTISLTSHSHAAEDHGNHLGLLDDDHTQYLKESDTAAYTATLQAILADTVSFVFGDTTKYNVDKAIKVKFGNGFANTPIADSAGIDTLTVSVDTSIVATKNHAEAYADSAAALRGLKAGETWTGVHDFGGATSLEIPNSADPTTDAAGEIAIDTDDDAIEVFDGTRSVLIPMHRTISLVIWNPDLVTDSIPVFYVDSILYPGGITMTVCELQTSVDGAYTLLLKDFTAADPPVDGGEVNTLVVGASDQRVQDATFTDATLAVGEFLYAVLPATDIDWIRLSITYFVIDNN